MMRNLSQDFVKLCRSEKGAVVVFFALALPPLLGLLGLGVEVGMWYQNKRSLQTQADAAAFAGAFAVASGHRDELDATGLNEAIRNGFNSAPPATIQLNSPPLTGPQVGNTQAVEAILTVQPSLLFASMFQDSLTIRARSVAIVQVTGEACVLALHPTINKAVKTQGSVNVNLENCMVVANSNDQTAIEVSGSGTMIVDTFWTSGNYSHSGSASLTMAREATTNAWPIPDPYADLTIPSSLPTPCPNGSWQNETTIINPGCYRGMDFKANSNITLNPGVYYVDRDGFKARAQSRIRCNCSGGNGVTIVLTSTGSIDQIGTVDIAGGSDVILRAPSAVGATYRGVLFFQDRRAPLGSDSKFNGGSTMSLTGAVYAASGDVEWTGNDGTTAPLCTQIVASTVTFIGSSALNDSACEAAGALPIDVASARYQE